MDPPVKWHDVDASRCSYIAPNKYTHTPYRDKLTASSQSRDRLDRRLDTGGAKPVPMAIVADGLNFSANPAFPVKVFGNLRSLPILYS